MNGDGLLSQTEMRAHLAGKRANTLIVFSSDNGGSTSENAGQTYPPDDYAKGPLPGNNQPYRGEKGTAYEGGIRVTAFANWPSKLKPTVLATPVHIIDWMPTFCDLAGVSAPDDVRWDGTNLWPHLTGGPAPEERQLYNVSPGWKSRALHLGDWKLIEHQKPKDQLTLELYNLATDPAETTNLAKTNPEKLATLQSALNSISTADRDKALPKFQK